MKTKISIAILLVLTMLSFSFVAFATNGDGEAAGAEGNEAVEGSEAQGEDAAETTEIPEETISEGVLSEPEAVECVIVLNDDNAKAGTCVELDERKSNECINRIASATEFPFVFDLEAFGDVDSLLIPDDVISAMISKVIPDTVAEESADEAEDEEEQEVPEFLIMVKTVNGEFLWKTETITGIENLTELYLEKADKSMLIGGLSAKDDKDESDDGKKDKDEKNAGTKISGFEPKEKNNFGIVFVEKDDEGEWNVSNQFSFGSFAVYVIAIVIIVLFALVLTVGINLIIIKIYRMIK